MPISMMCLLALSPPRLLLRSPVTHYDRAMKDAYMRFKPKPGARAFYLVLS